jgi:hypothetical protein
VDLLARFNLPKEIQAFEILIKCCKLVPLLGGKMSFADFLESLTAFEAGGSELAYAPTKNLRVLPADASTIGGSSAAVDWFRNSMEHSNNAMLFLVGAPGNGKSYLLKKITDGLNPIGDHSKDRRRFDFQVPEKPGLIVVNDASAPSESGESNGQLISDINDAMTTGRFLHANVNRGVLYQELRSDIGDTPISELLQWLSDTSKGQNKNWKFLTIQKLDKNSNLRCGRLSIDFEGSKIVIPIVIVLMDFYSIFERQPKHENQTSGDWIGFPGITRGEIYRIQLPRSESRSSREHWAETPAGQLLEKVVTQGNLLMGENNDPLNSICSNLTALQQDKIFCGVLSSLRNCELITSQHISFRELWTAIATMIIGSGESRQSIEKAADLRLKPFEWMNKSMALATDSKPEDRIKLLIQISATRLGQSLYGAAQSPFEKRIDFGFSPLLSITRPADPVLDACPTPLTRSQQFGWVSPVIDAMRAQIGDRSIIDTLKENARSAQIDFEYSSFDKAIDDEILHLLASDYQDEPLISKSDLEIVLMWYGDYLTRLFAISLGVTAFDNELHDWVSVWVKALNDQPMPQRTSKALMNILLPKFRKSNQSEGDQRLVSYLTSRTESITAKSSKPRLAIEITNSPNMRPDAIGDELLVHIRDEIGNVLLSFDLDFVLLREAMAFLDWPQAYTDNSISVIPKIERMRASLISKRMYAGSIRLINGQDIEDVQVR